MRGMRDMFLKLLGGVCGVAGSVIAGMYESFILRHSTYFSNLQCLIDTLRFN